MAWTRKKQFRDLWRTLCVDDSISNFVEDKTNLQYILEQSGVNKKLFSLRQKVFRKWEISPSLKDLRTEFGLPFVVQGWSKWGDGTIIVMDETDFNKIWGLKGDIRISEFCNQQYSSIYGLVVPGQNGNCKVIMDRPSYKVVGINDIGVSSVFWGGCDWSRIPHIDGKETIENITKIWEFLFRKFWYTWAIMIEWFIINGRFVINEINSRLWWGNEVSGFNQIMNWELPIQALHYAIMLGIKCDDLFVKESFLENHFYNRNGCFYIKVVWKWERKFKPGDIRDGLYKFKQDKIPNIWQIKWVNQANFRDGNFLITNCPRHNTLCSAKTHICMIEWVSWRERPIITGPHTVDSEIRQIAQLVYNTIQYE